MSYMKLISLLLITSGLILILLGGMYNPQSAVVTMGPGQVRALEFSMRGGATQEFNLKGTDYFTFYIMNETSYSRIEESNFTDSLYGETVKNTSILFTAPEDGKYYFVIANVNSRGYLQVVVEYGVQNNIALLISGFSLAMVAVLISFQDYRNNIRRRDVITAKCPNCGADVSESWQYCPSCGYRLREE